MANISLELPDVSFAAYTFAGEVSALRCSQLAVGSIASARLGGDGSVTLTLNGLSIACTGKYAFRQTFLGFPYGSGELVVASAGSSLNVRLRVEANASSGLPADVVMDACAANVRVQSLTFSGGLTAFMLDTFSDAISGLLEARLGPALCAAGEAQLAQLDLPRVFSNLTERAMPYMLAYDAPLAVPEPAPSAFAWSEVAFGRAAASLNDALCDPDAADLPGAAAALADLLGADAQGFLSLGELVALESSLPGLDGAAVRLRNVSLGGLGTLARLQLARPAGVAPADGVRLDPAAAAAVNRSGLVLELAFTRLVVRADVQLQHGGFDLCADGSFSAGAREISLSAVAQVPLLATALDTFDAEELLASPASELPRALGCLFASLDVQALALVRARIRLDALDVDVAASGPGRLWPMAAAAADTIVDALTDRFGDALMRAVGGLLSGPVSVRLASELERVLGAAHAGATCAPRSGPPLERARLPDAPNGALDWGQNDAFGIVTETLVNEALSDTQLLDPNALMRALFGGAGSVGLIPDRQAPVAANFSLGELATLDVRLSELALAGLDSVRELQIRAASAERPSGDPSAVVVRARLERLTIAAALGLTARPNESSGNSSLLDRLFPGRGLANRAWDVIERGEVALAFSGITVAVTVRLPLLAAELSNLTFYELISPRGPPCVLASIVAPEVRLIEAELDFASFAGTEIAVASSPLWDSVRPVVNLAVHGVLAAFTPALRSALHAALAAPPLYPLLDESLRRAAERALANITCAPPVAHGVAALPRSLPGVVSLASFAEMAQRTLALIDNLPSIANALIAGLSGGDGEVMTSDTFNKTIVASLELPACLGLLNVTLERVSVGGLASLTQLHLAAPEPAQDQSVRVAAAVAELVASADIRVSVEPSPFKANDEACARAQRVLTLVEAAETRAAQAADGIEFALRVAVNAAHPSVDTTVLVLINASAASDSKGGDATLGSILAPPCAQDGGGTAGGAAASGGGDGSNATVTSAAAPLPRRLNVTALNIGGTLSSAHVELLDSPRDHARAARAVAVIDGSVHAFALAYGAQLIQAAGELLLALEAERGLADRALRKLLLPGPEASAAACVSADEFTTPDGLIRWEAYRPITLLDGIARRRLGLRGMNALIRGGLEVLSDVPGAVSFGGALVDVNASMGARLGAVAVSVADATVADVDTLSAFALLQPAVGARRRRLEQADEELPALLETSFTLGAVDARALSVSASTRARLARNNATALELAMRLALSLADTSVGFTLDMRVAAAQLHAVPIKSLLNVDGWACVGAAVVPDGLRIASASASVGALRASASELYAVGAAGPSLEPLQLALAETGDELTPSLNAALEFALPWLVVPALNGALDARVRSWGELCATGKVTPSSAPEPDVRPLPKSQARLTAIIAAALGAFLVLGAVGYGWWWRRWRQRMRGERKATAEVSVVAPARRDSLWTQPKLVVPTAGGGLGAGGEARAAVDHESIELGLPGGGASKAAPFACTGTWRVITPVADRSTWTERRAAVAVCVRRAYRAGARALAGSLASESGAPRAWALALLSGATLCVFVWSNSTVQAELVLVVDSPLNLAREPISLYELSLGKLLRDMSKHGPTPAMLVVALLSGVWPQAKLLGVLVCWLAPPTALPPTHRAHALAFLHANGKWSLVEFALMLVAAVVFNLSFALPAEWFGDDLTTLLTVSTFAVPRGGIFGLLVGNLVSIAISHAVLACHSIQRDRERGAAELARALASGGAAASTAATDAPAPDAITTAAAADEPVACDMSVHDAAGGLTSRAGSAASPLAPGAAPPPPARAPPPPPAGAPPLRPRRQRDDELATGVASVAAAPAELDADSNAARCALAEPLASLADEPTRRSMLLARAAAAHLRREPLYRSAVVETRAERAKLALALAGLPVSFVLVIAGSVLPAFRLEITGLAGLVTAGGDNERTLSLVQLGAALPAAMAPATAVARGALAFIFFVLHLGMPVALPVAAALLWALPLTRREQRAGVLAAQFVSAVSGVDILMLALIVSLSELEPLGQFLLRGRCDALNKLLEAHAPLDLLRGDPRCFSVSAELERGYWVLLTAAIVSFVASWLVLRRCELALERRSRRALDGTAAASADSKPERRGKSSTRGSARAGGESSGVPVPVERQRKQPRTRAQRPQRPEAALDHVPHDRSDATLAAATDGRVSRDSAAAPGGASGGPTPEVDVKSEPSRRPPFASYMHGSWVSDYPLAAGDELPFALAPAKSKSRAR